MATSGWQTPGESFIIVELRSGLGTTKRFEGMRMARKVVNRKELREANDTAERLKGATEEKEAPAKKPPARRKPRAKAAKEVRLKAFWGVFSQSLTPVAHFEYSQRKEADQKATEMTESKKTPHFVQLVKKVIEE
jgi:hypothetical protein